MATMNFPILDSNYLVRLRTCNVADLPLDFTFGQKIFTKKYKDRREQSRQKVFGGSG